MSNASSVRIRYEILRSLDWTLVTANYVAVGTPLQHPARILKLSNATDADMLISFNGVDDHDFVGGNSYFLYDYGTNRSGTGNELEQQMGDRVYVKSADGTLPSTGSIYLTLIYASDN